MRDSTTLTIGIPTYNGSAYIRTALDSVTTQLDPALNTRVDILISDNGSTDETPGIISEYQKIHPDIRIHYSRNPVNLGYDKNVDMLFKKAAGRYVWLLADDDALKEDALRTAMRVLDSNDHLMAALVNFDTFDRALENVVTRSQPREDLLCHDAEAFLLNSNGSYGQVSSLILSRDAWNAEDLSYGFGSNFIHMFALFKILLRGDSYIINRPLLNVRLGSENFGTSGDALLSIALSTGALFNAMPAMGYGARIIRTLRSPARRYAYDTILIAKLLGIAHKAAIVKKLIATHNSPALWIKYIPIIFFPDAMFKRMYYIKKGISAKTRVWERVLKTWLKRTRSTR